MADGWDSRRRYMAGMFPIRCKTLNNHQYIALIKLVRKNQFKNIFHYFVKYGQP